MTLKRVAMWAAIAGCLFMAFLLALMAVIPPPMGPPGPVNDYQASCRALDLDAASRARLGC